ncbi:MAG: Polar-differentiation response regulator DivK [Syntrophus sp. SKADARSKE-3]|nr:Polar-differentiation response regulator DivK [Syntrophus sp. SKADARSKE-3]
MIIDDNCDDIEIARIALEDIGRKENVETATSGQQALKYLRSKENLPALILLDLKMPGMSGFDLLREIRADERLKPIPVIVVTSSSLDSDRQLANVVGANGFLYKELDIERFGACLNTELRRFLE